MSVRCKFRCVEKKPVSENGDLNGFMLRFEAVVNGSPENEQFFKYTPGGTLSLCTVNADAADQIEVGGKYYLDIIPA